MKDKLYLVMAYRYGCREGHIYPVGVYKSEDSAMHNAGKEAYLRGGKYAIKVFETRHPNKSKPERLTLIHEIKSPYENKLTSFSQTKGIT